MTLPNARDIALIFLILQALVGCAVPLVIFFFLLRGMMALNRKVEETMPTVQRYARQMAAGTDRVSERVTAPFISVQASAVRWQTTLARLDPRGRNGSSPEARPAGAGSPADRYQPLPSIERTKSK